MALKTLKWHKLFSIIGGNRFVVKDLQIGPYLTLHLRNVPILNVSDRTKTKVIIEKIYLSKNT